MIDKPKWGGGKDMDDVPLHREDLPCPPDTRGYLYLTQEERGRVRWDPKARHWFLYAS